MVRAKSSGSLNLEVTMRLPRAFSFYLAVAACGLAWTAAGPASAQVAAYPNKAITLVVA